MAMGTIFNIQKFCIHDGDGIRTCVFLKGCPLRCVWCHNPESIKREPVLSFNKEKCSACGKCPSVCSGRSIKDGVLAIDRSPCSACGKCVQTCLNDANEIIGKEMSPAQVMDEVMKDKMFYDTSGGGITITGGEPSYQPDFTLELLRLSKEAGISIAIETCGIGTRDFYESVADLDTTFLFDIKCIDPIRHKALTGADNEHILSNLQYLMDRGADIIIRIPMIPDCNDSDEDIKALGELLKTNSGRYRYAEIMPYHALGTGKAGRLGEKALYTHENATEKDISRWRKLFASYGVDVRASE